MRYIPFIFLSCTLPACETLREMEIPRSDDLIVVNGLFSTDRVFSVSISRSVFILDKIYEADTRVDNAKVELYQDGNKIEDLVLSTDKTRTSLYKSPGGFRAIEGREYELKVAAPGYESVNAKMTVPHKLVVSDFSYQNQSIVLGEEYRGFPVSITIHDPPNESNYYLVELYLSGDVLRNFGNGIERIFYRKRLGLAPKVQPGERILNNDPFEMSLFINDLNFDGSEHQLEFTGRSKDLEFNTLRSGQLENVQLEVVVKHITREHYEFGTSSRKQQHLEDDPFSEPIPVTTNIRGGLGIFSGFTNNTLTTEFQFD